MSQFNYALSKIGKELRRFVTRRILPSKVRKRIELRNSTPDFSPYPIPDGHFRSDDFDLIVATDLRFIGGSGQSTLEEVLVAAGRGWKVGLYHIPSKLVEHRNSLSPGIAEALNARVATLVNNVSGPVKTKVLLFRHPSVLNQGAALPDIGADHVLLIINHTPIKLGRIDYLLPYCIRQLRLKYASAPKVFPIGPLIRDAINEVYDGTVGMEPRDWTNIFDLDRFAVERHAVDRSILKIGRHSRPGPEKWPTSASDIRSAYPARPDFEIHVLGGSAVPDRILGRRPSNWIVHPFGAMSPESFLAGIDVFVYYHHPDWIEAFGRVIVEAMASGLPVVLPPHFKPLFKDSVIYSLPDGVADKVEKLKDGKTYMAYSEKSRTYARDNFGHDSLVSRLLKLGLVAPGDAATGSTPGQHSRSST